MNWDALGAIAELAGAIAVFATLLYLAAQIRQSNKLALAQYRETNRVAMLDISDPIIRDKELAELIERTRETSNGVSEGDLRRVRLHIQNELLAAQSLYIRGKLMGEKRMERISGNLARNVIGNHHVGRELWEVTEYDQSFKDVVDQRLAESNPR